MDNALQYSINIPHVDLQVQLALQLPHQMKLKPINNRGKMLFCPNAVDIKILS